MRAILGIGLIGTVSLLLGCPAMNPPDSMDIDDDFFSIALVPGFGFVDRAGDFMAETSENSFNCRFTSQSPEPLTQNAFFSAEPNHRLVFAQAIAGLTVRVLSNQEIVLWIRHNESNSNFCNGAESNSISRGSWGAGTYDVFIGSPEQGTVIDYTLELTE